MEARGEGSPLMQLNRNLRRGALEVGRKLGEGGVPGDQGANGEEVRGELVTGSDKWRSSASLDGEDSVGLWDQELD